MSSTINLKNFDGIMHDFYALPGTRLKQYVVDYRREDKWELETCPVLEIEEHDDNTGASCRNVGRTAWSHLDHDCCYLCNERMEAAATHDDRVQEWLKEKAKRPPIEPDNMKLSDEYQPDFALQMHPIFDFIKKAK